MSIYNIDSMKKWLEKWGLVAVMLLILSSFTVSSQDDRRNRRMRRNADVEAAMNDSSAPVLTDSLIAARDSIARIDSIHRADSVEMLSKSSLDVPAFTAAKDSIVEDFSNGNQKIYYYGDVSVT